MTMKQHRSSLIPSVEFSADGTILFTNPNQSFFLFRGHEDLKEEVILNEPGLFPTPSELTGTSDSNNNHHRKYKQRGILHSVDPVQSAASNSLSNASSSLQRHLRQSRFSQSAETNEKWTSVTSDQGFCIDSVGKAKSNKKKKKKPRADGDSSSNASFHSGQYDSQDVNSLKGRFSGGKPHLKPRSISVELERRTSSSPRGTVSSGSGGGMDRSQNLATLYGRFAGNVHLNLTEQSLRKRRFTEEPLPYVVFLIIGTLLVVVGILRLIISIWHEFGNGIWAGVPIISLGIVGRLHDHNYTQRLQSVLYIVFGVVSSVLVMVASGFTLYVLVPMIYQTILSRDGTLDGRVQSSVQFSNNLNHTLPYLNVGNQVALTLVLDFITLALLAIGFYSQTATVIAIDNYWGTNYDLTGDCDHHGNPRYFNPLEQMSIGQAVIFVGLVETSMIDTISPAFAHDQLNLNHGWIMVWDGILVILAAFISTCFGKRVDLMMLGVIAVISEFAALTACTIACIFTTMAISSVAVAYSKGAANSVQLISLIIIESIYDLVIVVNIIFIVGIIFRQSQILCKCCSLGLPASNSHENTSRFGKPVHDYTL